MEFTSIFQNKIFLFAAIGVAAIALFLRSKGGATRTATDLYVNDAPNGGNVSAFNAEDVSTLFENTNANTKAMQEAFAGLSGQVAEMMEGIKQTATTTASKQEELNRDVEKIRGFTLDYIQGKSAGDKKAMEMAHQLAEETRKKLKSEGYKPETVPWDVWKEEADLGISKVK